MKGRCCTCVHWKCWWPTEEDWSLLSEEHRLELEKQFRGSGSCARLTAGPSGCRVYPDSDPISTDWDFGCLLWEEIK